MYVIHDMHAEYWSLCCELCFISIISFLIFTSDLVRSTLTLQFWGPGRRPTASQIDLQQAPVSASKKEQEVHCMFSMNTELEYGSVIIDALLRRVDKVLEYSLL